RVLPTTVDMMQCSVVQLSHIRQDGMLSRIEVTFSAQLLFALQRYNGHRDLHSFPTRRSSDLPDARGDGDAHGQGTRHPDAAAHRSEEHTSELQSRENLVCRLLLEKRKT